MKELNHCIDNLQALICKINITNCNTIVKGKSLTEWIAIKDCLTLKIQSYREVLDAASRIAQRATRSEIKILSAIDVNNHQKELDAMSKELRIIDNIHTRILSQPTEMRWKLTSLPQRLCCL